MNQVKRKKNKTIQKSKLNKYINCYRKGGIHVKCLFISSTSTDWPVEVKVHFHNTQEGSHHIWRGKRCKLWDNRLRDLFAEISFIVFCEETNQRRHQLNLHLAQLLSSDLNTYFWSCIFAARKNQIMHVCVSISIMCQFFMFYVNSSDVIHSLLSVHYQNTAWQI